MMKNYVKNLVSILFFVLIVSAFTYYISSNISDFKQIRVSKPILLLPLFLLTFIGFILSGLVIKYLVMPFDILIKFKEWFGLSILTSFYNTLFPFKGGLIIKATYLKKKFSFSITNFIALMAGTYIILFFVSGLFGLLTLLIIYYYYNIFNIIVLIIFSGLFLGPLFIIIFSPKLPETKNPFINKFIRIINGWHFLKNQKKILLVLIIILFFQNLLGTLSTILYYAVFGIHINFIKSLFLVCISSISVVFSITPAGLGINEAVSVFSALVLGITPVQSIPVAILSRVITTIFVLIFGPVFSYIFLKDIKNNY